MSKLSPQSNAHRLRSEKIVQALYKLGRNTDGFTRLREYGLSDEDIALLAEEFTVVK